MALSTKFLELDLKYPPRAFRGIQVPNTSNEVGPPTLTFATAFSFHKTKLLFPHPSIFSELQLFKSHEQDVKEHVTNSTYLLHIVFMLNI